MNWYDTTVEEKLAKPVRHHAMVKAEDKEQAVEIAKETANSQASLVPKRCRLLSVDDETIMHRKENSASWPNRIEKADAKQKNGDGS